MNSSTGADAKEEDAERLRREADAAEERAEEARREAGRAAEEEVATRELLDDFGGDPPEHEEAEIEQPPRP